MKQFYLALFAIAAALACAVPVAAHADTTYDVTGNFSDVAGSPLTGTYTINAAGVITAADLTLQGLTFDILNGGNAPIPGFTTYSYAYVDTATNPSDYIELEILHGPSEHLSRPRRDSSPIQKQFCRPLPFAHQHFHSQLQLI
jgi:hypothetical protein